MPTYTNASTTETKIVTDINGVIQHVAPGGSIQTYDFLGSGWTETAATPVFNPVISSTSVTLDTTGVVVALNSSCISFAITEITDTVTAVYTEAATVTPPLMENITSSLGYIPSINLVEFKTKIRKIILKGSGTCKVVQYRV